MKCITYFDYTEHILLNVKWSLTFYFHCGASKNDEPVDGLLTSKKGFGINEYRIFASEGHRSRLLFFDCIVLPTCTKGLISQKVF